ncbi:MAG: hypothetical protein Q4D96_12940 [Propionibacteriaceae bacterium]|nr:hypothetical protein [Propionibacteriaceae bacterium]
MQSPNVQHRGRGDRFIIAASPNLLDTSVATHTVEAYQRFLESLPDNH